MDVYLVYIVAHSILLQFQCNRVWIFTGSIQWYGTEHFRSDSDFDYIIVLEVYNLKNIFHFTIFLYIFTLITLSEKLLCKVPNLLKYSPRDIQKTA